MGSAVFVFALIPLLLVALWIGAMVAVALQARQRGYSFIWWFVAQAALLNPVVFLVVLALMPNRRRKKLREQFRAELQAKLAGMSGVRVVPAGLALPAPAGSTLPADRSLGDVPTILPPERSLGDEETRGA